MNRPNHFLPRYDNEIVYSLAQMVAYSCMGCCTTTSFFFVIRFGNKELLRKITIVFAIKLDEFLDVSFIHCDCCGFCHHGEFFLSLKFRDSFRLSI